MKGDSLLASTSILLVDGVGASLTAVGVGVVLPALQPWFGVPVGVLRVLGAVALGFALFSLGRHFSSTGTAASLRQIAVANLCYCLATATMLVVYRESATTLAYAYFGGEIAIVTVLAWRELRIARQVAGARESELWSAGPMH